MNKINDFASALCLHCFLFVQPFKKNIRLILKTIYFLKLSFLYLKKDYEGILKNHCLLIRNNLAPYKKSINHDLFILKTAKKFKLDILKHLPENPHQPKIMLLMSDIYDSGGHTEVALRYIKAFKNEFPVYFCLSALDGSSCKKVHVKSDLIKSLCGGYFEAGQEMTPREKITFIYNNIIANKITTLYAIINPADSICCAVMGLIKKNTGIKIIFYNHASHCFSLGTEFADVILTRCRNSKPITPYLKNKTNALYIPFMSEPEQKKYSQKEIENFKKRLNIKNGAFVTLTGAPLHKTDTGYFKMISKILSEHKNVCHILAAKANAQMTKTISSFAGANKDRFIITPPVADFNMFAEISDLYIDSFPQGSALTLVDFIKHSKPVVIKKNFKNSLKSFELYLFEEYPYTCCDDSEMFEKISKLITDKTEYEKTCLAVKKHYISEYNIETVKNIHRKLIQ